MDKLLPWAMQPAGSEFDMLALGKGPKYLVLFIVFLQTWIYNIQLFNKKLLSTPIWPYARHWVWSGKSKSLVNKYKLETY